MNEPVLRKTYSDSWIYILLAITAFFFVFPFLYVFIVSITPVSQTLKQGIVIFPHPETWSAYRIVIGGGLILPAYKITLLRTVLGTTINMLFTITMAYPLAKKKLPGRSGILMFVVFTMLFNGGLIPTYLLVHVLGLLNTLWALILPGLVSVFNMLVMKNFFEQLPLEIEESAKMDGAGEMTTLIRIILPLSLPIIATISLFYAVYHWNSWFDALMYINNSKLFPLQIVLRNILLNEQSLISGQIDNSNQPASIINIQMAAVMVATIPILCVYPFVQKYFVKGILIGSVKG